jgi:DNA (cytosine-5)-methyltransferase 1
MQYVKVVMPYVIRTPNNTWKSVRWHLTGGFPLAGQRNGITAIWASEIEPFPIKVTKIRFPGMKHRGDITKIIGAEIEPVDIITGGSPCQDLSVAGKRAGLAGARSGLFMEQVRIVREMRKHEIANGRTNESIRPRFMLWENVPGAFSSNKGEDFRAVLEETARVADETVVIPGPANGKWSTVGCIMGNGYSIAWRILDAQYWGVPQRRRRIFLVADFGGQSAPEILFKREGLCRDTSESGKEREGIAADAEGSTNEASQCLTPWDVQSKRIHKASGKWPTLYSHEGGGGAHGYAAIPQTFDTGRTSDRIEINPSVAVTLKGTGGGGGAKTGLYCVQAAEFCTEHSAQSRSIGYQEECSPTLRKDVTPAVISCQPSGITGTVSSKWAKGTGGPAGDEHYNLVCTVDCINHKENTEISGTICSKNKPGYSLNYQNPVRVGYSVRRLTPLECERLQDYEDGWTDIPGASDSGRYKACGNSVAVCCPDYVLEGIKEVLQEVAQ